MNIATSQNQLKENLNQDILQSPSNTRQQTPLASQAKNDSPEKESISKYSPASLWSNLRYGLGMLAFIVIPPLIPGATVRLLIMGYMFMIVSVYTVAAIVVAMRVFRPTKTPKSGRTRMQYR